MRERAEAMVLASFAADSHALGAHWIYDPEEIKARYGRVERLLPAPPDSVHAGRSQGSFTHYGDQALLLLRYLASSKAFRAQEFAARWREFAASYDGYRDRTMQETLRGLEQGAPVTEASSGSTELSAAGRIAPLVYLYRDELDEMVNAAGSHTTLTHNSTIAVESTAFLARVLWRVLNGKTPTGAIARVLQEGVPDEVRELVTAGLDTMDEPTAVAAERFGRGCDAAAALPLTVHLVAAYEGSLKGALVENVGLGGDSAARGMIVGMILGAFHGRDAIPDEWIEGMHAYREISTLLEDLEATLYRNGASSATRG